MSEPVAPAGLAAQADRLSQQLAWLTDRVSALLLLLVFDVWLGV